MSEARNDIKRALVVVPTYNEAENIGSLLSAIRAEVPALEVVVVDDSSPDGTGKLVQQFMLRDSQVHLITRPKKEGLAAAYLEGFSWGLEQGYDALIEMDADFSHDPKDLKRIVVALEHADVVVGCRYMQGGGFSGWGWTRQFISRGGNVYAQTLLGLPYKDLTGGFNAWSRKVLEAIDIKHIRSKGYAFQVELKFRAHKAGFTIQEVPIHFRNRVRGKSKMSGAIVWEAAFKVLNLRNSTA